MKKLYVLFAGILVAIGAPAIASAHPWDVTSLNNKDILLMVEKKITTEAIVEAIKTSPCTFDTFPSVLREMKRRGVPEEVLEAMLNAPYGPSAEKRSTEDLAEDPIYHYTESIKQYLAPANTGRRSTPAANRARAARNTRIRR